MDARQPFIRHGFGTLPGWGESEARALLAGVMRHLAPGVIDRPAQARWLSGFASALGELRGAVIVRPGIERCFEPVPIVEPAFLTAYYEPVIAASRVRTEAFATPLMRRPRDLVRVSPGRSDLPGDGTFGRALPDGTIKAHHDRAAIYAGALDGLGLEIAYLADPVDAFFAQVQGSARLRFEDGTTMRVGYHGKTGHPYTPIGRVLVARGALPPGGATMQAIRSVLAERPELVRPTLEANRSYVFFRERETGDEALGPVAAGGVQLVPMRSLAVDRAHIAHGTPVFVETVLPEIGPIAQVMIAEDAGSAIIGAARGDVFIGSGDAAGAIAGRMAAPARLTLLLPRAACAETEASGRGPIPSNSKP